MAPARVPASTPPARLASRPRSRGTPRRDDALVAPAPSDVPRRSVARGPRAARLAAANGFREKSRLAIRRDSRWTFLAPRTKRDSARRDDEKQSVSRRSFSVSREEQEKSSSDVCRTTDADTLPTDDPPPVPFFTTHAPRISSTTAGPLLREVRGWYERQRSVVRKGSPKNKKKRRTRRFDAQQNPRAACFR